VHDLQAFRGSLCELRRTSEEGDADLTPRSRGQLGQYRMREVGRGSTLYLRGAGGSGDQHDRSTIRVHPLRLAQQPHELSIAPPVQSTDVQGEDACGLVDTGPLVRQGSGEGVTGRIRDEERTHLN